MAIAVAFVAGSLVTGSIAFGEDGLTKLGKECSKIPKSPEKIKPHCELLAMINAIPAGPLQIYEVSLTVPIGIQDDIPKPFSLKCLEGDTMYVSNTIVSSLESVADPEAAGGGFGDLSFLKDGSRNVGVEGLAVGTLQLFEYEITATILCLSP